MTQLHEGDELALRALPRPSESLSWTRDMVARTLERASFSDRVAAVVAGLEEWGLVVPDVQGLSSQLVTALDTGHVVLQGPPGTGKTTLARILARSYQADLHVTTSNADWSTYDVIGGLRPAADGTFVPALGVVAQSVLACAEGMRDDPPKATWLLIDEFNRADIDKAIGSMYTVLSSNAPSHLEETPLELWFERATRQKLWVPSAFRIIATMNDVDASYVNSISQGLTRRFQFVTLGVAVEQDQILAEVQAAMSRAAQRWTEVTGQTAVTNVAEVEDTLANVIFLLREPSGDVRWPIGTAQISDVWFSILVRTDGNPAAATNAMLDICFADTVVHQASNLSLSQLSAMATTLASTGLPESSKAARHLADASSTSF